jgi:hypothetical protein
MEIVLDTNIHVRKWVQVAQMTYEVSTKQREVQINRISFFPKCLIIRIQVSDTGFGVSEMDVFMSLIQIQYSEVDF